MQRFWQAIATIVHGKGTGALRQDYRLFENHRSVKVLNLLQQIKGAMGDHCEV